MQERLREIREKCLGLLRALTDRRDMDVSSTWLILIEMNFIGISQTFLVAEIFVNKYTRTCQQTFALVGNEELFSLILQYTIIA